MNRVKTDTRDAKRLALILENNDVPSTCDIPDKERREDRQISWTLIAIQKDITRTRNRIRKFLDFHAIEVPFAGKDKWDRKEFRALKELPLCEPLKISLHVLLTVLEQFWVHQTTFRASLRQLCRKERYRKAFEIARSAPKKIAGFVGLTPGEYSTGETTWKGRITGMGPGFIRATLIENSWIAIRKDPILLGKFMRIWRGTGSKKKAIVAVARMLIVRLRACIVSGTPYVIGVAR